MKRSFLVIPLFVVACAASLTDAERHQRIVTTFPLQTTTRDDVTRRVATHADFSRERPSTGWSADDAVGQRCLAQERRNVARVHRVDRYLLPEGIFSLGYYWFYFDSDDHLIDAEWQYASD